MSGHEELQEGFLSILSLKQKFPGPTSILQLQKPKGVVKTDGDLGLVNVSQIPGLALLRLSITTDNERAQKWI